MIRVSLGIKKQDGGFFNIDFEPVFVKFSDEVVRSIGVSKMYEASAFDEDQDDTGNRRYLGEIHFNGDDLSQWKYTGTDLNKYELRQLNRYFKNYKVSGADDF
ncbi:MAG: hypothetical protein JWP37_682 [Mucilaginibacter sp.]|nr:hypothetical protein [Mucilaginibacter sp.]